MINEVLRHQKKLKTSQTKGFCQIRSKEYALKNPYIQVNPLNSYAWIVIDCDYNLPYFKDMPVLPNYIVRNKSNNRGHLYFKISEVHNNGFSSYKAIEYCNAVRYALTILFNGDLAFTQTLSKNPLAVEHWRVEHLHSNEYELGELAEYCELVPQYRLRVIKEAKELAEIIGRNQTIFDCTRVEVYKMDKPTLEQIRAIAESFNNSLDNPLPNQEIKHITKSIYKYVSKPKNLAEKEKLSERQRERGKKSGVVRAEKAQKTKDKVFVLLANKKLTLKAIAEKLEVSYKTVKNINAEFKKGQRTISGSPPCSRVVVLSKQIGSYKVEDYLVDTFSLYREEEHTEKIPINTIGRLLE
jgi:hypothetical protein